ncbi:hypothetical protein [Pseudomonas yamanorum]
MGNKKPAEHVDKIIRAWLEKRYNEDGSLYLSINYSKLSPPGGTATFSGGSGSFNVIFECGGAITMEKSPFTLIRDGND